MAMHVPGQSGRQRSEAVLVPQGRDAGRAQASGVAADSHPIAHAAVAAACREGAAAGRRVACLALAGRVNREDKSGWLAKWRDL